MAGDGQDGERGVERIEIDRFGISDAVEVRKCLGSQGVLEAWSVARRVTGRAPRRVVAAGRRLPPAVAGPEAWPVGRRRASAFGGVGGRERRELGRLLHL